jgi:hypothetical protein
MSGVDNMIYILTTSRAAADETARTSTSRPTRAPTRSSRTCATAAQSQLPPEVVSQGVTVRSPRRAPGATRAVLPEGHTTRSSQQLRLPPQHQRPDDQGPGMSGDDLGRTVRHSAGSGLTLSRSLDITVNEDHQRLRPEHRQRLTGRRRRRRRAGVHLHGAGAGRSRASRTSRMWSSRRTQTAR